MDRMLIVGVNEMARFLGMTPAGLLRRGELPEPDFMSHSNKRIWLPATAEAWNTEYTSRPEFGVGSRQRKSLPTRQKLKKRTLPPNPTQPGNTSPSTHFRKGNNHGRQHPRF